MLTPITSNLSSQLAFISRIGGYARTTRFYFEIDSIVSGVQERLNRSCMSLSIPGKAVQSQPNKIYGPPSEFAYEINYNNEFQMSFRVGEDYFERDFFDGWIGSIVSPSSSDLAYPDTYRRTMRVYQLDMSDNKVYGIELYNVFCKSIGDIELSTDASDQIAVINVTLGYSESQTIGKTNFWYDSRKDRGAASTSSLIRDVVENDRSRKLADMDLEKNKRQMMMGDLKHLMDI